jgi:hypothetical protein
MDTNKAKERISNVRQTSDASMTVLMQRTEKKTFEKSPEHS